jgi:hypothetical protein
MQRTYLALASLCLAGAGATAAVLGLATAQPAARAQAWEPRQSLFEAQSVDPRRYAVLGRPLGNGEWTLLVLEQILAGPPCWQNRPDGLVDPSLNRFDFTGICGRFIDSNGYSLRLANQEGAGRSGNLRLRLQQNGPELQLLATAPELARELVVGRGPVPARDRDGFVALRLAPGWELQRRTYQGQRLNHLYFANRASAEQLVAAAGNSAPPTRNARLALPPPPPPPPAPTAWSARNERRSDWRRPTATSPVPMRQPMATGEGRVVALQVIPYRE